MHQNKQIYEKEEAILGNSLISPTDMTYMIKPPLIICVLHIQGGHVQSSLSDHVHQGESANPPAGPQRWPHDHQAHHFSRWSYIASRLANIAS